MRSAALVGAALVLCAAAARADEPPAPPARCTLRVIHALPQPGGIDPRLPHLRWRLSRPPFSDWHTFKLMSEEQKEIAPTGKVDYPLPDGRHAELVYAEHALGPNGRHIVRGSLTIAGPKSHARTMFALDEGGVLLVADARHQGGILIYALSCKTEK